MSTYTPVASQTLSSAASSVTFSGIPQDYTDLVLVASMADSNSGGDQRMLVRVNNDSGTSYSTTAIIGDGTTATSGRNSNRTIFDNFTGAGNSITSPSTNIYHFMNYSNVTTYKTVLYRQNNPYVSAGVAYGTSAVVGLWRSTAAINRIDIFGIGNMVAGSTFALYGIQAGTPKAQGGQIVTTDGTYWYHAFTASGTFTPSSAITADVLVVAGGGGGASYLSAGGGAGGITYKSSASLSSSNAYSVVVGAGGNYTTTSTIFNGSDSKFDIITAIGGGGAGLRSSNGANGGSGGGGSGQVGTITGGSAVNGSNGTTYYGNAGGNGNTNNLGSGGGGGAGAAGTSATANNVNYAGGAGISTYSSWGVATNTGHNVSGTVYFGGGGMSGSYSTSAGSYSNGGGGYPGGTANSTAGIANTGGGGGGGSDGYLGSNGGSGIVIVRYSV